MNHLVFENLHDLAKEFLERFNINYSNLEFSLDNNDKDLSITIPAQNREFGEMSIWIEHDEIVICLGEHFHIHFERYSLSEDISIKSVRESIITEAMNFIKDVLADDVLLKIEMKRYKLLNSSISYLNAKHKGGTFVIPVNSLINRMLTKDKIVLLNTWSRPYNIGE